MKVIQKEYGTSIDILFNLDPYTARPIMVSDEGVTAVDGKKIVKAGSLLDVDGEVVNDETARYVLLKDIDVTYGPSAGAGVYRGTLDLAKIEKNLTTDEEEPFVISEEAKMALKGIIFMYDEDMDYVGGTVVAAGEGITVENENGVATVAASE